MKKIISVFLSITLILLTFSACSGADILKGKYFDKDYRDFLKNMRKELPVSVEYELYSTKDGYKKENLIVDTDQEHISSLTEALADVKVVQEVKNASNFNVKHYTFTDKDGKKFTFDFYGEYLKVGKSFYEIDNYVSFTNIRLNEKQSGSTYLALDCIYHGSDTEKELVYIGAKEIKVVSGKAVYGAFNDYKVLDEAEIISPASKSDYSNSEKISLDSFFKSFDLIKGEENSAFIFKATIKDGVITSLTYDYELSSTTPLQN